MKKPRVNSCVPDFTDRVDYFLEFTDAVPDGWPNKRRTAGKKKANGRSRKAPKKRATSHTA